MSKTFTLKRTTPAGTMAEIERTMSLPITKQEPATVGKDAVILATELVAEMFADVETQASKWHGFAWRVIDATTDMRVALQTLIETRKRAMKEENATFHGWDSKAAGKAMGAEGKVGSYIVNVSRINTIAKAFNAGATVAGFAEFSGISVDRARSIGWRQMYDYCKTFLGAEAGRTPDSLLTQFDKFVSAKAKGRDGMNPADLKVLATLERVLSELKKV